MHLVPHTAAIVNLAGSSLASYNTQDISVNIFGEHSHLSAFLSILLPLDLAYLKHMNINCLR